MRFASLAAVSVVLAAQLQGAAMAAPVNARISAKGLDFIRDRVIEMVPKHLDLDPVKVDMFTCSNYNAYFELQNPKVDLAVNKLEIKLPEDGVIRVEVGVTINATGKAHFEKLYACYGRETCDARVSARNAVAIIDVVPSIDVDGKPHVEFKKIDVQLEPSDVDITLSNCPEDDIVNLVVGFVKDYGLKLGIMIAENLAQTEVAPLVEGLVTGFLSYSGDTPTIMGLQTAFKASLVGIDLTTAGMQVRGDLDVTSKFPAAACIGSAGSEPSAAPGATPDLGAGLDTHIGVAVNFGIVQDVLYHVWHEGMLCVTPQSLKDQFGLDLNALNDVGKLLPGFPDGTTFTFEGKLAEPPVVEGNVASSAKLSIHVNGFNFALYASLPNNGGTRSLKVDVDASVSASVVMDPSINALALQVDGVKIDRMAAQDGLGLDQYGIEFDRIRTLLETVILPDVLGQVGQIPITGPVFGGIEGVPIYVILKELKTTPAYLVVKADLFKAPDNDREPPTTSIEQKPAKIVRPADARVVFGGTDKLVPTDLLRYKVTVDGVPTPAEPTYVKQIVVGEAGKSQSIRVEVHAVDLAGNVDPTGASATIEVDGVVPVMQLKNTLRGTVDELRPTISWTATDDRSSPQQLRAQIVAVEMPNGGGAETEVMNDELDAGATSGTLDGLQAGKQYRLVLTIRDEAGNEATSTQVFAVSADAGAGGCAVGHQGNAGLAGLALAFAALVAARRRRA